MGAPRRSVGWLRLAGALAVAALAGCAAQPIGPVATAEYRADASQAHHDLYFVPGAPELAPGEPARLKGFLGSLALRPEDDILLRYASSGSDPLDRRRLAVAWAALSGTPARLRIVAEPGFSRTEPRPDVALVQVRRYDRLVVVCPAAGLTREEAVYLTPLPPLGCVNAVNRAVMAASLRDLTAPRRLEPSDASAAIGAVRRYRAGPVAPAPIAVVGGS